MIFESSQHALHYAAGLQMEVVFYEDQVIDVTDFKQKHPGGSKSIEKHIGKDVTEFYNKVESHTTKSASRDLKTFCIGRIKHGSKGDDKQKQQEVCESDKIDLQRGVIWQVFTKLNLKEYLIFIHDPKHMINPSEAILFEKPYLEVFTKTKWWLIPILWLPVVFYHLYNSIIELHLTTPVLVFLFLVGMFLWTLMEYVLHRFLFHVDEGLPDNRYVILLHFLFHGIHHAFPMDRYRYLFVN